MNAAADNVHHLREVKAESENGDTKPSIPEVQGNPGGAEKDMSKVAIVISLMAIVLIVVFFYGLNSNLRGLSAEVAALGGLRTEVADVKGRVVELEKLPTQTRSMIMDGMIDEMAQKAAYLGEFSQDAEKSAKLEQVRQLLQELRAPAAH